MTFVKGQSGNPVGMRPKRLTDQQLELVTKLATRGSHEWTIAHQLGVSPETWRRMRDHDKQVRRAYQIGRGKMHDYCVGTLLEQAQRAFVPPMWLLKTKFDYVEAAQPAPDNAPRVTIVLPGALTDQQYRGAVIEQAKPLLEDDGEK